MAEGASRRTVWLVSGTYASAASYARSEDCRALFRRYGVDRVRVAVKVRQLDGWRGPYVHVVVVEPWSLGREMDQALMRLQDQGATLEHRSQW